MLKYENLALKYPDYQTLYWYRSNCKRQISLHKIDCENSEKIVYITFEIYPNDKIMSIFIPQKSVVYHSIIRLSWISLINYETSVAQITDTSNTFWQSVQVWATEVLL